MSSIADMIKLVESYDQPSERYLVALQLIVERSKNDPMGTSKVVDMRKIAEAAMYPQ